MNYSLCSSIQCCTQYWQHTTRISLRHVCPELSNDTESEQWVMGCYRKPVISGCFSLNRTDLGGRSNSQTYGAEHTNTLSYNSLIPREEKTQQSNIHSYYSPEMINWLIIYQAFDGSSLSNVRICCFSLVLYHC